jgi:hypothetical protein
MYYKAELPEYIESFTQASSLHPIARKPRRTTFVKNTTNMDGGVTTKFLITQKINTTSCHH